MDIKESVKAIRDLVALTRERMGPEADEQHEDLEIVEMAEQLADDIEGELLPLVPAEDTAGEEWVKAGEVGVDAGMLMLSDPCYLRSEWLGEGTERTNKARGFRHKDGRIAYCMLHGDAPTEGAIGFHTFEQPLAEFGGMKPNDMIEKGILKEMASGDPSGEFSYGGCCEAAMSDEQAGQLNYRAGHAGAGVVFSSGMGDGHYPVYIRYANMGQWGTRIAEMRVVMIGVGEEEKTSEFMEEVCKNSARLMREAAGA